MSRLRWTVVIVLVVVMVSLAMWAWAAQTQNTQSRYGYGQPSTQYAPQLLQQSPAIVVSGGSVFVAASGYLYKFDARTLRLDQRVSYLWPGRVQEPNEDRPEWPFPWLQGNP